MTRKHFEAIAQTFRIQLADPANDAATLERVARMLCIDFKTANRNFDTARFLQAAGF